jgi:hypothetical protein
MIRPFHVYLLAVVIAACSISVILWPRQQSVWVEPRGERIAVVGKTDSGATFDVLIFDKKLMEGGHLVGIDMSKAAEPSYLHRMIWAEIRQ